MNSLVSEQKGLSFPGALFSPCALRRFSKVTCFATLLLIFMGGLVTSTGSGLAVPDWPLSYGTLFPPMVGGIVYEHSHRMVAATVGFLVLILTVWVGLVEKRRWVRNLSIAALGAVVCQGILGGLTVLFFLPKPISIFHAVLAQTFFVLTIFVAYSQSWERQSRQREAAKSFSSLQAASLTLVVCVYIQLIVGALMRHTASGLAIPDFPTMGGSFVPLFNEKMLKLINAWRFEMNLDPVVIGQVVIHFLHRLQAVIILGVASYTTYRVFKEAIEDRLIVRSMLLLDSLLVLQITLGAMTIWSGKGALITSAHVMTGAAVLGMSVLFLLRVFPISLKGLKR